MVCGHGAGRIGLRAAEKAGEGPGGDHRGENGKAEESWEGQHSSRARHAWGLWPPGMRVRREKEAGIPGGALTLALFARLDLEPRTGWIETLNLARGLSVDTSALSWMACGRWSKDVSSPTSHAGARLRQPPCICSAGLPGMHPRMLRKPCCQAIARQAVRQCATRAAGSCPEDKRSRPSSP